MNTPGTREASTRNGCVRRRGDGLQVGARATRSRWRGACHAFWSRQIYLLSASAGSNHSSRPSRINTCDDVKLHRRPRVRTANGLMDAAHEHGAVGYPKGSGHKILTTVHAVGSCVRPGGCTEAQAPSLQQQQIIFPFSQRRLPLLLLLLSRVSINKNIMLCINLQNCGRRGLHQARLDGGICCAPSVP